MIAMLAYKFQCSSVIRHHIISVWMNTYEITLIMNVVFQGDWWFARNRNKPNGPEGYIPSNYIAKVKSLESEP